MLKRLKEVVAGKSTRQDFDKKVKPKEEAFRTFGGKTNEQIQRELKSDAKGSDFLAQPKVGESAQISLNQAQESSKRDLTPRVGASSSSLAEEIATLFSEGEQTTAIKIITDHLNENKGNVDKRFWYMLMDGHQVSGNRQAFEKVALAFSHKFETSSPSWFSNATEEKPVTMMAGKNIIILESIFKITQTERFKDFLKASREEKFCRINVSQCKFEMCEPAALKALHKLFKDLRKYEVKAVLMGDNNLINFCKSYINPLSENKSLKPEFLAIEELLWLLYLEVLQWKGRQEDFENVALDYAMKFEVSPPGWEDNGVMKIEAVAEKSENESQYLAEKVLNSNNIQSLLDIIKLKFETSEKCQIDFGHVERIDFSSAGSISFFIQELWSEDKFNNKKVILQYPNEIILTLLEMVGATEFIEIIPRKR